LSFKGLYGVISQETKYLNTAVRISNPKISLNTLFINFNIKNNKEKKKFTLENYENDNILMTKTIKIKRSIRTTILISKLGYCHV
jgi:hypothetical protein